MARRTAWPKREHTHVDENVWDAALFLSSTRKTCGRLIKGFLEEGLRGESHKKMKPSKEEEEEEER